MKQQLHYFADEQKWFHKTVGSEVKLPNMWLLYLYFGVPPSNSATAHPHRGLPHIPLFHAALGVAPWMAKAWIDKHLHKSTEIQERNED